MIPAAGLAFMLLLFPTGRLSSRRWRSAAWFVAAVFTLDAAAEVARASRVWADPFIAASDGWYRGSHAAVLILVPAALLVGGAAVAVRFVRSSGEERLQLKWFVLAGIYGGLVLLATQVFGAHTPVAVALATPAAAALEPAHISVWTSPCEPDSARLAAIASPGVAGMARPPDRWTPGPFGQGACSVLADALGRVRHLAGVRVSDRR